MLIFSYYRSLHSVDNVAVGFSDNEDVASELCDKPFFVCSIEGAIVTVNAWTILQID